MACSDFVADFLTVIRNSVTAKKESVTVPASKMCLRIAEILKEEGFIDKYKEFKEGPKLFLRLHHRYMRGQRPAIQGIRKISKPGLRVYSAADEIRKVRGGLGIAIISTSKGVLTDRRAREQKVGGEVLCNVW